MEVTLISIKDRLRGYGRINQTFCSNGGTVCSSASWTVDSNQWLAGLKVHFESRDCQCSEVAHAPSFTNHGRCWVAIGRRISFGRSPDRVLGLPLLPARTNLRLSGPLPILDFPVVSGERLGNPFLLRDQSPICRLCAPAIAVRTTALDRKELRRSARK